VAPRNGAVESAVGRAMRKLWILFIAVNVVSFAILGWVGSRIYEEAPPIPDEIVTGRGRVLVSRGDVSRGQNVWQAMGGMQLGSVWGHGSYVAPDWTADWLHREAVTILDGWGRREHGKAYSALPADQQAALQARLEESLRHNTYDPGTGRIAISEERARAFEANLAHYADVFSKGRNEYAIPRNAQSDPTKLRQLASFFFWTAWAATTDRPGERGVSYTNNWPHEPLVGNRITGDALVWTGVSIILLLAGIAGMVVYYARRSYARPADESLPVVDPLVSLVPTPSQVATIKYVWVASILILVQIVLGVITAHYGVEGDGFYGIPLSKYAPYVVTRTWHVQLGLFWIATAWLAAGLFIGPLVGTEPRRQKLLVNVLFAALLLVVVGSLAGQWLSTQHKLTGDAWFLFGHQGYEYVELGRVWQIALFAGLLLWFWIVVRAVRPALKGESTQRPLLGLFLVASVAIPLFYAPGLVWGRSTNLSIVEYWRWWVVHLWVEGFFEVFATAVIAFFFARLGLVNTKLAAEATLLSAVIYLSGGIIGTLHHLYFAGTPTVALAFGSVFSALEVVPLVLVGYAAWEDLRLSRAASWVRQYRWPIHFFIAVAFWNMLGAGLFGFMINPPVALYYMQGLNTTPVHGHGALFGVYGLLGMGLMLFCMRVLRPRLAWRERWIQFAFWSINAGLLAMVLLSLLPLGLLQTWASVEHGYWYARSAEFLQTPVMNALRWMRVPGDSLFAVGAIAFALFIVGLKTGHSYKGPIVTEEGVPQTAE
jgi:nitric oxide reductase subunit B